jgi:hypothetical protein
LRQHQHGSSAERNSDHHWKVGGLVEEHGRQVRMERVQVLLQIRNKSHCKSFESLETIRSLMKPPSLPERNSQQASRAQIHPPLPNSRAMPAG